MIDMSVSDSRADRAVSMRTRSAGGSIGFMKMRSQKRAPGSATAMMPAQQAA